MSGKDFCMTYQSSFGFESCHFNGQVEYDRIGNLVDALLNGATYPKHELIMPALEIMAGTHGHNFRVEFFIGLKANGSNSPMPVSYLIDDVALSGIVAKYNRKNLSVVSGLRALKGPRKDNHADAAGFAVIVRAAFQRRATTENLARDMLADTLEVLKMNWVGPSGTSALLAKVTVHETDTISASAQEWLQNVVPKGV